MAITHGNRLGLTRWSDDDDEWDRDDFDGDNATLEEAVAIDGQGLIENRPAAAIRGRYYYATDIDQVYRDSGTAWAPVGNTPLGGGLLWFIPGNLPPGYLEPTGQELSRTTYAALFALWGTFHGPGNGTTTFNMPNLKGLSPIGHDPAQAEFDTVGETGGAKTHTLSSGEMPSHQHTGSTDGSTVNATVTATDAETNPVGTAVLDRGDSSGGGTRTIDQSNHAHSFTTNAAGGGEAHNNLHPYKVVRYLVRVQ